jgi:hypothetical protein
MSGELQLAAWGDFGARGAETDGEKERERERKGDRERESGG